MKKFIIPFFLLLAGVRSGAQTGSEWFRQKETQIQYLLEQLAAFQVYAGSVRKGYEIAANGLNTLKGIKQGDLSLHEKYFAALRGVNSRIRSYPRTGEIVLLQAQMLQVYQKHQKQVRASGQFTTAEMEYFSSVYAKLMEGGRDILHQLNGLIKDGFVEMTDDERLRCVDALYGEMQERYVFARHFAAQTTALAIHRLKEGRDVRTARKVYGMY